MVYSPTDKKVEHMHHGGSVSLSRQWRAMLLSMAELVYIDETGSVGKGAKKQPLLRLAAVVVPEEAVSSLASKMNELVMNHLGWRPADFEWHAFDLWNARGYWEEHEPPQLLAAFEAVIALLDELDIKVVHSAIHKQALHDKYQGEFDSSAYLLALQFMLEKIENWKTGKLRLVIADEAKEHQTRAVRLLRDMQNWGLAAVPGVKIESIVDSMHYVDSKDSPGVQLADFVAFVIHRASLPSQNHPDADAAVVRMRTAVNMATVTWREAWPRPK